MISLTDTPDAALVAGTMVIGHPLSRADYFFKMREHLSEFASLLKIPMEVSHLQHGLANKSTVCCLEGTLDERTKELDIEMLHL